MGTQTVELDAWRRRRKVWDKSTKTNFIALKRRTASSAWYQEYTYETEGIIDAGYLFGVEVPEFHARLKSGQLLPHTTFIKNEEHGQRSVAGDWTIQTWGKDTTGNKYPGGLGSWFAKYRPVVSDVESRLVLEPQLLQRAAAKVYSKAFDAGTFLAELAPTLEMFYDVVNRLFEIARLRRINLRRLRQRIGEDGDSWYLEARYGWRPLVSDIKNLMEALQDWVLEFRRISETARYKTEFTESRNDTITYYFGTVSATIVDTWWVSHVGSLTADITYAPWNVSMLMTSWEKIPFSFMVDWLLHVGQMISAIGYESISLRESSSVGSAARLHRRVVIGDATFNAPTYTGTLEESIFNYEIECKMRKPMSVPYRPYFGINLNLYKVVDAILILNQLLKR